MSALTFIAEVAAEFSAVATLSTAAQLELKISLARADKRSVTYDILAYVVGEDVFAKEKTPSHLPAFCPERHINSDGSFCLYWKEHEGMAITDAASACHWWQTLREFLLLQERAKKLRRWPGEGWAHGTAAIHQKNAEDAAAALGSAFAAALNEQRLAVKRGPKVSHPSGPTLRVHLDGEHVYTVWRKSKRLTNKRRPCICTRGKKGRRTTYRSCGDHALQAAQLAVSIQLWKETEEAFWDAFKNDACCGTCDNCPLKTDSVEQLNEPHPDTILDCIAESQ